MTQMIRIHSKSKRKTPNTAKSRELDREWEELKKKYAPKKPLVKPKTMVSLEQSVYIRETPKIASLSTAGGSTAKAPDKVYTGTKMLGIGTLHKSNGVPIFSEEEAHDIAKMRR